MIDDNSLPMARKNKVIIFDGNNLFFSCYAANETINSNNVHIGGIIGSLASLQKICIDVKPHEIFVVWVLIIVSSVGIAGCVLYCSL